MQRVTARYSLQQFGSLVRDCSNRIIPYPLEWMARLVSLCEMLEALSDKVGTEVTVLSGYRREEEMERLGDLPEEWSHAQGYSADIVVVGMAPQDLVRDLFSLKRRRAVRFTELGLYPQFVHISQRPGAMHYFMPRGRRGEPVGLPTDSRETLCITCHRPVSRCVCPKEET